MTAARVLDAVTPRTRAIVLNSPGNPTGALIAEDELATIARETEAAGVWLVIDLCYEQLVYGGTPHNLARVVATHAADRAVLVGSASKSYAMTGWRCGWAIGPRPLIAAAGARGAEPRDIQRVVGHAARGARGADRLAGVRRIHAGRVPCAPRSDDHVAGRRARLRIVPPAGAFYLFPGIGELLSPDGIRTSADFAARLLDEAHVALTPGEAFDAPGFVRLSYATSLSRLTEGAERLLRFVAGLP